MFEGQVSRNAQFSRVLGPGLLGLTTVFVIMEVSGTGSDLWVWRPLRMRWVALGEREQARAESTLKGTGKQWGL